MDPDQNNPPVQDANQPVGTPAPVDQGTAPTDQAPPAAPASGYTDAPATQALTVDPPATFLGMPVNVLIVSAPLFLIAVLVYAWLTGRQPHTEQLTRLDKQRKRLDAREAAKPQSVDIFTRDKENFLSRILAEAGLEAQYDKMKSTWILAIAGTTVVLSILALMQAPALVILAVIIGPGLGSFGFFQYVKWQGSQRQQKLVAQLPQVLETMVSTLKAGSPVVECFKLLSETSPDPIRSEFRRALVSLQLGKPFREVLAEMGTRIRAADFRLLTQAIFISQDVGANLADVVATIAEAIRERFRLRDFLASLTAQGKMTALFIGALPYFITVMTYWIAPGYIMPFLNHPIARIVFIAMMIWEGIGAYILVKMTTFEV
ncbi:MAG: type II secretion system F family protein [Candidatus Obscuribacterales bacterium]|nr:type II secretion system F family protein [Candidatus Obscuribacterales bacterium]